MHPEGVKVKFELPLPRTSCISVPARVTRRLLAVAADRRLKGIRIFQTIFSSTVATSVAVASGGASALASSAASSALAAASCSDKASSTNAPARSPSCRCEGGAPA